MIFTVLTLILSYAQDHPKSHVLICFLALTIEKCLEQITQFIYPAI
jgi:hypothetical protein